MALLYYELLHHACMQALAEALLSAEIPLG